MPKNKMFINTVNLMSTFELEHMAQIWIVDDKETSIQTSCLRKIERVRRRFSIHYVSLWLCHVKRSAKMQSQTNVVNWWPGPMLLWNWTNVYTIHTVVVVLPPYHNWRAFADELVRWKVYNEVTSLTWRTCLRPDEKSHLFALQLLAVCIG